MKTENKREFDNHMSKEGKTNHIPHITYYVYDSIYIFYTS